ncbi:MAG: hypothetical protein H7Z17_18320 [Fuerstia sp.]|nr:hypothetical protein [Fuerstiella sp.]
MSIATSNRGGRVISTLACMRPSAVSVRIMPRVLYRCRTTRASFSRISERLPPTCRCTRTATTKMFISTRPVRLAKSRIEISVLDNGSGIKPEHIHRVFDPFFTTKDVGEGMGMGLNICYRMMKQMGGGIEVDSQPDVSTKLTLWLPLDNADQERPES